MRDLAAVQQMDPARVGSRDHVQLGRQRSSGLGVGFGLRRACEGEHRAVDQRRLAEGAALGVEALGRPRRAPPRRRSAVPAALGLRRTPSPATTDARAEATEAAPCRRAR